VALYRQEKVSLSKAANIAGISLIKNEGINPRLGVEGVRELEEDSESLKNSRKLYKS